MYRTDDLDAFAKDSFRQARPDQALVVSGLGDDAYSETDASRADSVSSTVHVRVKNTEISVKSWGWNYDSKQSIELRSEVEGGAMSIARSLVDDIDGIMLQ
ncbi:hypothetical protein IU474_01565 [Nocardia otitidiscaviarum]|uniref:hypothetical protein n=1 Tax=Nocardia otitidiscaviarum TaxID=1823 RepID=UPI001895B128|nr:hypothetical protein [Nocardia otitidiscaviarum]MBF6235769.1 hypothetical protein [Nocardia otitidiscaviarum]